MPSSRAFKVEKLDMCGESGEESESSATFYES